VRTFLGLDLSLNATGMVAVPADWNGEWHRIRRHTYGEDLTKDAPEPARIGRLLRISSEVLAFARLHRVTDVVCEQYAFSAQAAQARALGELGGVVKVRLSLELGLNAQPVPPASARKLLLGKLPTRGVKEATHEELVRMGMPIQWGLDEMDAFVVANWAMAAVGCYALAVKPLGGKGRAA